MTKQRKLLSVFTIAFAVALLLPGLSTAGSLEPPSNAVDLSGSPVPTMKTLDEIPPTWSQRLPADDGPNGDTCNSSRFKCVMDGNAVLDKETGLVWRRYPVCDLKNWYEAHWSCAVTYRSRRIGWRLPTIYELASLLDNGPLPNGHPFLYVEPANYWAATSDFSNNNRAWAVDFGRGGVNYFDKTDPHCYWCVRGGLGVNYE